MYTSQILEKRKKDYIPTILNELHILETRNLLAKESSSGRVLWKITPIGCSIRDQIERVVDSLN